MNAGLILSSEAMGVTAKLNCLLRNILSTTSKTVHNKEWNYERVNDCDMPSAWSLAVVSN